MLIDRSGLALPKNNCVINSGLKRPDPAFEVIFKAPLIYSLNLKESDEFPKVIAACTQEETGTTLLIVVAVTDGMAKGRASETISLPANPTGERPTPSAWEPPTNPKTPKGVLSLSTVNQKLIVSGTLSWFPIMLNPVPPYWAEFLQIPFLQILLRKVAPPTCEKTGAPAVPELILVAVCIVSQIDGRVKLNRKNPGLAMQIFDPGGDQALTGHLKHVVALVRLYVSTGHGKHWATLVNAVPDPNVSNGQELH